MLDMATLEPLLTASLGRVLGKIHEGEVPGDLAEQVKLFGRLKAEWGRAGVAAALGLQEAELPFFDAAVRDAERMRGRVTEGDAQSERNAVIAGVRLLSWIETVGQRKPELAVGAEVEALVSEDVGRKQVRALELIVRSLITESYGGQEQLLAHLREALNEKVVRKWQAGADAGDVLSGCTFSELAGLFVSKEEFARYETLYEDTPFLTLLKQRRKTIQAFLDDVRRIRNALAHNKRITNTQLSLLDLYYEEIVTPLQTAHDEGETKVDPAAYLDVSKEELEGYFGGLSEDVQAVRDDLGELRTDVMASLGALAVDTAEIKETTKGIDRKLLAVGGGVIVVIAIVIFLVVQGGDTKEGVETVRETTERTEEVARKTADDVEDIRETTKETAEATREVAEKVEESTEATREVAEKVDEATEAMKETTEKVVQTLEELREGFAALAQTGGIIADAKLPQQHYHNARIYEQQGDYPNAMRSYRRFFAFEELEFVDPHLRFQSFLKLQNGAAGAREAYYDMKRGSKNRAMAFAWNLLLDGEGRVKGLESFLEASPDFAPAYHALSRDFSMARLGTQSMADKRREKELLENFLALKEGGEFLRFYLDQSVAAEQVEDAKERLAALSSIAAEVLENPVQISASRSNQGWTVSISIADTVKEIFYRIGTEGDFQSTGFVPGVHTQGGLPLAKPMISLGRSATKSTVQIKYSDPRGNEHGPFDLVFDPDQMMLQSTKNTLGMLKNSWISFRDYDDKVLVYFSTLLSYRVVLKEIRYGVDTDTPDTVHPFSPADPKNPYAVNTNDATYIDVPEETKTMVVQLLFVDDTTSEIVRFER